METPTTTTDTASSVPASPPRKRIAWLLAIIGAQVLFLLLRPYYIYLLPAPTLLTRGHAALHAGAYRDAERCLLLADARAGDEVTRAALRGFYWRKYHDNPIDQYPLGFIYDLNLPKLAEAYHRYELQLRGEEEDRGMEWLAARPMSDDDYHPTLVACHLFDEFWPDHPDATRAIIDAMGAMRRRDAASAWAQLTALETRAPKTFALFCRTNPFVLRVYTDAAWQSGHTEEARALATRYAAQPPCWVPIYDEQARGQIRIDPGSQRDALIDELLGHSR